MSQARKAAPRLARPAQRYWKGKAPKGVNVQSDSEEEDSQQEEEQEQEDVPLGGDDDEGDEDDFTASKIASKDAGRQMNVALRNVNISGGKVIVDGREESGRTEMEEESEEESEEEAVAAPGAAAESGEEESGSEYETDSEEEEKPAPAFRPVFVPKRGRVTVLEREAEAENTEDAQKKKELEAQERKKETINMIADSIQRELAEKETQELIPDVDDTDGLDPTAEFEAWRLRELGRIKKEKAEQLEREEERREIERRRAMPEEQRLKEDLERAQKSRDEKPKGQQKFLQKYWHKGAFHQDQEILKRHDFTQATESTIDVSLLPKVMQVKNFGKRSQTKYTHLLDQDTSVDPARKSGTGSSLGPGQACFTCGGPHLKKDCPQNALNQPGGSSFGTGSNGAPVAPRKWGINRDQGDSAPPKSWRDRDDDRGGDSRERGSRGGGRDDDWRTRDGDRRDRDRDGDRRDRDGDRRWSGRGDDRREDGYRGGRHDDRRARLDRDSRRSRSRSRSRSPPRYRERRRSRSRSPERYHEDKRRKVD